MGEVSVVTYNTAIKVHDALGDATGALDMLAEISQCGLQPDLVSYNTAICACENAGAWEWALWLLREMEEHGVQPDIVS